MNAFARSGVFNLEFSVVRRWVKAMKIEDRSKKGSGEGAFPPHSRTRGASHTLSALYGIIGASSRWSGTAATRLSLNCVTGLMDTVIYGAAR